MLSYNLQFSVHGCTYDVCGQRAGFIKMPSMQSLFGVEVQPERLVRWDENLCPMCPPEFECKAPAHRPPPLPRPRPKWVFDEDAKENPCLITVQPQNVVVAQPSALARDPYVKVLARNRVN